MAMMMTVIMVIDRRTFPWANPCPWPTAASRRTERPPSWNRRRNRTDRPPQPCGTARGGTRSAATITAVLFTFLRPPPARCRSSGTRVATGSARSGAPGGNNDRSVRATRHPRVRTDYGTTARTRRGHDTAPYCCGCRFPAKPVIVPTRNPFDGTSDVVSTTGGGTVIVM